VTISENGCKINQGKKMNALIEKRRSIRKFKPGIITREQIDQLLEAAMHAPSARNSRPWEFLAITKRETLDYIPKIHPYANMCQTAGAAIIVVGIPQSDGLNGYFAQDCAAATQNILLEAVSMGLGSCWCGVYPREERMSAIRVYFKIPESKIPFNVIAIGTPDEAPAKRGFFDASRVTYIC